jgi:acyl phosphate:glycerol-3-phosphate acyltransferase
MRAILYWLIPIAAIALSYLAGSVPTGLWLGLRFRGIDIREHGSGNVGATNTLRTLGKQLGAIALLCDMAKGALPVLAAMKLALSADFLGADTLPLLCGLSAIFGHTFSLFLHFKGGKGVATSAGVFLALAPLPTLAALYAFAVLLVATQMVSAASIGAAIALALTVFLVPIDLPVRVFTLLIAFLVVVKHRSNMGRIVRGEESRMWTPRSHKDTPPDWFVHPSGTDCAAAVLAGIGALIVYSFCLAPTVSGEDSGEFITAAVHLGIPHPPGYPLWVLTSHLFTYLPFGNPAWQVSLASAVFASCAIGLAALLMVQLTRSRGAAVLGALALAFSREFWQQAVIAEVYALNAFLVALALYLLWRWHSREQEGVRTSSALTVLAIVVGLSQGNHNTMVLLAPLMAVYILVVEHHPWRQARKYAGLITLAFASAAVIYSLQPLRSMANPPVDWGNPETLSNWWDVIRRKQFMFMMTQYPRSLPRFIGQVQCMGGLWLEQFNLPCMLLAGTGFLLLLRRRAGQAIFLMVTAITIILGFTLVQNFELDKEWRWIMSVFPIPAYLITSIFIAVAVAALLQLKNTAVRVIAICLVALSVAAQIHRHGYENDKSDYYWVADYGQNVLRSLEPDAIWVPQADHQSFSALYWEHVENLRPDVQLGRTYGYVNLDIAPKLPEERKAIMGEFPPLRYDPEIFTSLLQNTGRPVYFSKKPILPNAPDIQFVPWGLVYRALRPGETAPQGNPWEAYTWRNNLDYTEARGDYTAELILSEIAQRHAEHAFDRGDQETALKYVEESLDYYGHDVIMLTNLGTLCARNQAYEKAHELFTQAAQRAPNRPEVQRNLKRVQEKVNR